MLKINREDIMSLVSSCPEETLLFYYGLLDFISEKGKKIVKDIIEQEKSHVKN
jgi:rubrerythrin